jgi:hypothetical protein
MVWLQGFGGLQEVSGTTETASAPAESATQTQLTNLAGTARTLSDELSQNAGNARGIDAVLFGALVVILVGVLWLICEAALTGSVHLGQGSAFPAIGTGLLGAVINPSNAAGAPKPTTSSADAAQDTLWRVLVVLAMVACVVTGWAVWDHRADAAYSSSYSVPALIAALSALAGVYANLASITKRPA